MKELFIHLSVLMLSTVPVSAADQVLRSSPRTVALTYYVSPSGDDTNPGNLPTKAWRTISRVNHFSFGPGSTILFEGGQIFSGGLHFDSDDFGNPSSPITVGSYGVGRATISAGHGDGILVHNTGGFRISNIKVVGSGRVSNKGSGIRFNNELQGDVKIRFIRIDQVEVNGFGKNGISVEGNRAKSGFCDVRITRAEVHDNALAGISVAGEFSESSKAYANEDVYIGYSKSYNNSGVSGKRRSHSGNGILLSDVNRGIVERSVAYGNGWLCNSGEGGPVGIWAWDSNQISIQHNESYGNRTGGEYDGGGFDLDAGVTNSAMQFNYSHDNDGPGYLLTQLDYSRPFARNTIRYNISQNDGRKNHYGAIHIFAERSNGDSSDDKKILATEVYNNTVYMTPTGSGDGAAIYIDADSTADLHVRNNIFQTTGGIPLLDVSTGQKGLLFQGNDFFSSGTRFEIRWLGAIYGSFDAWRAATGQERADDKSVGRSVDPELRSPGGASKLNDAELLETLDAYRLRGDSPLIDAGLDLRRLFGVDVGIRDYYGNSLTQRTGFAIGAHQY